MPDSAKLALLTGQTPRKARHGPETGPAGLTIGTALHPNATSRPIPPARPLVTRILLPTGLMVAVVGLLVYAARDALLPAMAVRVAPVVIRDSLSGLTDAAEHGAVHSMEPVAQAPGWIEADPYIIAIPSLADGVVRRVHKLEGEQVRVGDLLVELVSEDAELELALAEANLRVAEGDLRSNQAALDAATTAWKHPVELDRSLQAALAGVRRIQAEQQRLDSETVAQKARLSELQEELDRLERASSSRAVSAFELAIARLRVQGQRATLDAAAAQQRVLAAQLEESQAALLAAQRTAELRIDDRRALDKATADVEAAIAKRDLAAARLAQARLRSDRMVIRSPVDGIVQRRLVGPGSKLMAGMDDDHSSHVFHLYNPASLQVRVDVPLADAARVTIGQKAEIIVDGLGDRRLGGEVTRVVHQADLQKNTVQFKLAIRTPHPLLKPEMLARVRFLPGGPAPLAASAPAASPEAPITAAGPMLLAPAEFVVREGQSSLAWRLDRQTSTARPVQLQLAPGRTSTHLLVLSGLQPGDLLIDPRTPGLRDGLRVRPSAGDVVSAAAQSESVPAAGPQRF